MNSKLGELETLAEEGGSFAAAVARAELVRTVARLLRAMRERTGLTQSEFGGAIGLSQGRVSQLESGLIDHAPSLEAIALYANTCGESVRFEASGGTEVATEPDLSFYGMGSHAGRSVGMEVVCNVDWMRSAMVRHSGITHVRGSENRLRLSPSVSARFFGVLGFEPR